MTLPKVLAGPIIRRADPQCVYIWLATSEPLDLGARIYAVNMARRPPSVDRANPVGEGVAIRRVQLGTKLFVHLIAVAPRRQARATYPSRTMLAYDIFKLARAGEIRSAARQGLSDMTDIDALRLAPFPLPTFVLQRPNRNELVTLYASCRKLHGKGADAAAAASALIGARATSVEQRPTALLLGGDQIYADDVSDVLILVVSRIGEELQGNVEPLPSVTGAARTINIGARQLLLERDANFTSTEAGNHLMTFGEFAATYLLAWNPEIWPTRLPDISEVWRAMGRGTPILPTINMHAEQSASLEDARRAGAGLRKVLANTPTYMIFDDHEVTDDWNLNDSWTQAVMSKPLGRRILANGLAAFWAFQGWGNNPEAYDPSNFTQVIEDRLNNLSGNATLYERTLLDFRQWSFVAPTQPGIVFIDSRTGREAGRATYDLRHLRNALGIRSLVPTPVLRPPFPRSMQDVIPAAKRIPIHGRPAQLMSSAARNRIRSLCQHLPSEQPAIFMVPAPVFGLEVIENAQDLIARMTGSYKFDLEHWHANPESLLDFMDVIFQLRPNPCILLSGDVHYAFEGMGEVTGRGVTLRVGQFTSSAMKNESPGVMGALGFAQTLAQTLGIFSLTQQRNLYWRAGRGVTHILNVSNPIDAALELRIRAIHGRDPDLREAVEFRTLGLSQAFNTVLGLNNIGEVRVRNRDVTHRFHFARSGGGTGSTPQHRL